MLTAKTEPADEHAVQEEPPKPKDLDERDAETSRSVDSLNVRYPAEGAPSTSASGLGGHATDSANVPNEKPEPANPAQTLDEQQLAALRSVDDWASNEREWLKPEYNSSDESKVVAWQRTGKKTNFSEESPAPVYLIEGELYGEVESILRHLDRLKLFGCIEVHLLSGFLEGHAGAWLLETGRVLHTVVNKADPPELELWVDSLENPGCENRQLVQTYASEELYRHVGITERGARLVDRANTEKVGGGNESEAAEAVNGQTPYVQHPSPNRDLPPRTKPVAGAPREVSGFLTAPDLVTRYRIPERLHNAFDQLLRRWRKKNAMGDDYTEHDSPQRGHARYLYRESAVLPDIQAFCRKHGIDSSPP